MFCNNISRLVTIFLLLDFETIVH